MPQSLSSVLVHLIFATKGRAPFITPGIEPELYAYMATVFRACDSPVLAINGTTNHVHVLCALSRKMTMADLVEEAKKRSSKWIKTKGREFNDFRWQTGYGAFSIGESNVAALKAYIDGQKEHHRRRSFEDEYRAFLQKYGVHYDEAYLWD